MDKKSFSRYQHIIDLQIKNAFKNKYDKLFLYALFSATEDIENKKLVEMQNQILEELENELKPEQFDLIQLLVDYYDLAAFQLCKKAAYRALEIVFEGETNKNIPSS